MSLWGCADCSTAYSVGAPACPHCGSTNAFKEGSVPKITRHGGPTDINAEVAEVEGGDESSPGTSSSASEEKQPTASATSRTGRRKHARTTANRSVKDPAESASAASTDGSTPATG
jgi:hypothetical protein